MRVEAGLTEHSMRVEAGLTEHNMNQRLLNIEYAVRGPLVARADRLQREIDEGARKPFPRVVRANIGDCHALGQPPVTFVRQVVSLAACPALLPAARVPADVKDRVREILGDCTAGSVGAYSPACGLRAVRARAAWRLSARDGVPARAEDVYLGAGATDLIQAVLALFAHRVDGKPPAVMIPVPQYPVFSGSLAALGVRPAYYYLDEGRGWALDVHELERSWREADAECCVRAIVVINPGNPTGQVMSREDMEAVVRFAHAHHLFLLADEVYQENIVSKPFHSFKKVIHQLGAPYRSGVQLASFMTASKGWAAECGARAGLVELCALRPRVRAAFERARALSHCPAVLGQCVLDCVLKPPAPGEPSHEQFQKEITAIGRVLADRTAMAHEAFNSIPGYSCNPIDGAMFAFPRVEIPARAQREAAARGQRPDEFYCERLLEEAGICVVPGSGFGQRAGTHHFRTTVLHARAELTHVLRAIEDFHRRFLKEYH